MQAHQPQGDAAKASTATEGASGGINPKLEAKLRKLLALAERGEGGEKDNAQRMLDKLLARHSLTIDDLIDERREIRWFPAGNKFDRPLAAQILAKICNTIEIATYTSNKRKKQIGVQVTPAEAIEFELHYDTLRKALAASLDDAFSAFVQANKLFPCDRSANFDPTVTDRDLRVLAMASAISATQINPRLEHK
ncbi:DUF2786 domain-containing protein [Pseudomonas fluorescens]|uniref:DUF2786 domain-containing protein n=1 Tax=Pseudomonas fluorescens TaxID=294 RepID=UPI00054B186B|nr:DUF2786 domain-containing protein [Pseudomonas fluorescens]KII38381.1 hypothetical protein RY26_02570 [Pseudomonas fluorescens]